MYNSRFYASTTAGIYAFTQNGNGFLNWVVPPIHLVGRALRYMEILGCEGILVVPVWYIRPIIGPCYRRSLPRKHALSRDISFLGILSYITATNPVERQTVAIRLDFGRLTTQKRIVIKPRGSHDNMCEHAACYLF